MKSAEYSVPIDGLREAVEACPVGPGHEQLVRRLSRLPGLEGLRLTTTRCEDGGSYLARRAVYTAAGERVLRAALWVLRVATRLPVPPFWGGNQVASATVLRVATRLPVPPFWGGLAASQPRLCC